MSTYEQIYVHEVFNTVIDSFIYNKFISSKAGAYLVPRLVSNEDLKKSVWLASVLASSEDENHQSKVQLFASLLYLQLGKDPDIERLCYILMSRVGNLAATSLFVGTDTDTNVGTTNGIYDYDALLSFELAFEKDKKTILLENESITATKFQESVWRQLSQQKRISISAPTSAGKSFMVKKHIQQLFSREGSVKRCLYIVPSRALINQVSEEFRTELLGSAQVFTTFLLDSVADRNAIYILTPERCLRLLKSAAEINILFDIIFIDEIQNVEDVNGRGTLLEFVVEQLGLAFPTAQIVTAGPNIINPGALFARLINGAASEVKTTVSPVIQIRSVIRGIDDRRVSVKLLSNLELQDEFTLDIGFDLEEELSNIGKGLARLIDTLCGREQSIIYAPKTNLAEGWALHYTEFAQDISERLDPRVRELIEYLSEEIHPRYYLINCLKRGTAFHHSRLPEMVRREIEDCFATGRLDKLFCTSTLIEGVNLPARNLFIVKPEKRDTELTKFEFGNLIGRAGRIGDSLYGNVYCIERSKHYDWATPFFTGAFGKEVLPATDRALMDVDLLLNNIRTPINEISADLKAQKNTIILFRQKQLIDSEAFRSYLEGKGLESQRIKRIAIEIAASLNTVQIPVEVARNNPTIDPILQDALYKRVAEEGIERWVIHYNSNLRAYQSKADIENLKPTDRSLFWQLLPIVERLNEIFDLRNEAWSSNRLSMSIRKMCFFAVRWMSGDTYSSIIRDDIRWKTDNADDNYPFDPSSDRDINNVIRNLAKTNNVIVSHILVKYMKLLNDVLENRMTDLQKETYKFSLAIPSMLELGTTNGTVVQLISAGISRSVALKVLALFQKVPNHEEINIFDWLKSNVTLNLPAIYNRYLRKLRLLRIEKE